MTQTGGTIGQMTRVVLMMLLTLPIIGAANPPDAPLDLNAKRENGAAHMVWIDPSPAGNETITGHELEVAAGPDYTAWSPAILTGAVSCQAANPSPCTATIGGLANGTNYKIRIRTLNQAGPGTWVVLKNWVTPDAADRLPEVPANLLGHTEPGAIRGSWTPVTSAGQGATVITRYRLVALSEEKLAGHCDTTGNPPAATCTISGLPSGVPVTLQVRSFNDRGKYSDFSAKAGPYTPN